MDLGKFLSLLDRSALYFSRVDKLADADPFEGYYTNVDLLTDKLNYEQMCDEWRERANIKDENAFNNFVDSKRSIREYVKAMREVTFINSWHVQEHESAAMWSSYLRSLDGIAVQSTYRRLADALAGYSDFDVFIGLVRYIDYDREAIPWGNALFPFMHKRKSFEHERESRALIWTPQHGRNEIGDSTKNRFHDVSGLHVRVDLNVLIQRIFVAPTAPAWIVELISSLILKFGPVKEVVHSRLADSALY
jgi:hypothetical protein